MLPYSVFAYGNPHSRTHAYGWEAEAAVEKAREVRFASGLQIAFVVFQVVRQLVFFDLGSEEQGY